MAPPSSEPVPKRPTAGLTPLGIIAAFVALAETVTGIAATQTAGPIQVAFTSFAIAFPLLVAVAFFAILWKRPYVLYPPKEFGAEVDVKHYVDAMRQQVLGNQEMVALVRTSITEAVGSSETRQALSALLPSAASPAPAALREASSVIEAQALDRLKHAVVTIDVSRFDPSAPAFVFPYESSQTVFSFLSSVYFQLNEVVPPYSYGRKWALEDLASGELLLPRGIDWTRQQALAESTVTVAQFGLTPGMQVRAVPLRGGTGGRLAGFRASGETFPF